MKIEELVQWLVEREIDFSIEFAGPGIHLTTGMKGREITANISNRITVHNDRDFVEVESLEQLRKFIEKWIDYEGMFPIQVLVKNEVDRKQLMDIVGMFIKEMATATVQINKDTVNISFPCTDIELELSIKR